MFVSSLALTDIRNHSQSETSFASGITIIEGLNAAGKTTILEALTILAYQRSPLAHREYNIIKHGASKGVIRCEYTRENSKRTLGLEISSTQQRTSKRWRKGSSNVATKSIIGEIPAVLFKPNDLDVLQRSSSHRRQLLDDILLRTDSIFVDDSKKLQRVLIQRRSALELLRNGEVADLDGLNQQLIQLGARISYARAALSQTLEHAVQKVIPYIAGEKSDIEMEMTHPLYKTPDTGSSEELLRSMIEKHQQREIFAGRNLIGPQREDVSISLNGNALREFGSRGEWRTTIVSLKLAELDVLEQFCGERPPLLLDDVLSELDLERRQRLSEWFTQQQTIFATTDKNELPTKLLKETVVVKVVNGTISNKIAKHASAIV